MNTLQSLYKKSGFNIVSDNLIGKTSGFMYTPKRFFLKITLIVFEERSLVCVTQ
ncbi:hypothetical protein GCM10008014_12470 [Paenibacillus silvae]|uniref:Uncharacterized protein n=1 Tax=Paenibacillus silvae TaxID=1325358 RepID=A0ABQ1Z354_9BACL|nr:hypothetical protein GCM10008014_12470 [Paenibacillus silvae]